MTHDEMIAVIAAHKNGATVQFKFKPSSVPFSNPRWQDLNYDSHPFNFSLSEYRVKPRIPKDYWIYVNSNGQSCVLSCKPPYPEEESHYTHVREVLE